MKFFQFEPFPMRAAFLLVLFPALVLFGCGEDEEVEKVRRQPPPRVIVEEVRKTEAKVFREYPARVHGSRQVQVRARVQGILKERQYEEGRFVERDEVLFLIDPERYRTALRRAEAELSDARAGYDHAKREWERHSRLYEANAVSARERDQALTNLDFARARLGMAEAALEDARRNLSYTEVRSPIAGMTDIEDVSEGNLIDWGGLLTTITQNDPVHIRFSLPEKDAVTKRAAGRVVEDNDENGRSRGARVILGDGREYGHEGVIDFMSSTIDPATGTVSARAVFPNPEHDLFPGQFVRVRVLLQKLEDVFLIPERAVSQGRDGARVFVVNRNQVAEIRPVELGPVVEGGQVILSGLDDGDLVVVNGHVAVRDGVSVTVVDNASAGEKG